MKRTLLTRGAMLTAVSTLAITFPAPAVRTSSADMAASADTTSEAEHGGPGEQRGLDGLRRAVRRGCSAVPTEGEGSFTGMTDDPVATAASNNPALSTLVAAVTAANLGDTLNTTDDITVLAGQPAFEAVPPDALNVALLAGVHPADHGAHPPRDPGSADPGATGRHAHHGQQRRGHHRGLRRELHHLAMDGTVVGMEASVICGNVQTANATIYIIDQVLKPAAA